MAERAPRTVGANILTLGSTYEERVRALSDALQELNPQRNRKRYDALFDVYVIMLHRDACGRCCPESNGPDA